MNEGIEISGLPVGLNTIEDLVPVRYRLACKSDGELVLQGCYISYSTHGCNEKWREIPTVILEEE